MKDSKGNAKTDIGGIQKGILKNGINFKKDENLIKVDGTNADGTKQATTAGVEDFALKLSDKVGKEIGGTYFSGDGGKNNTAITLGGYGGNRLGGTAASGEMLGISANLTLRVSFTLILLKLTVQIRQFRFNRI